MGEFEERMYEEGFSNPKKYLDHLINIILKQGSDRPWIETQLAAIETLGIIKDKKAIDPLITTLKNGYPDLRIAAAKVLGEFGDNKARRFLVDEITPIDDYQNHEQYWDFYTWYYFELAVAIAKLRKTDFLIRLLVDYDFRRREHVANILSDLGESIWKDLINGNDFLSKLALTKNKIIRDTLIETFWCHLDNYSKIEKLKAIELLEDKRALDIFIYFLFSRNDLEERVISKRALIKIHKEKWVLFADENSRSNFRLYIGDYEPIEHFTSLVLNEIQVNNPLADRKLHKVKQHELIRVFEKALVSNNLFLKNTSIIALGIWGQSEKLSLIKKHLLDNDITTKQSAIIALGLINDYPQINALLDILLKDEETKIIRGVQEIVRVITEMNSLEECIQKHIEYYAKHDKHLIRLRFSTRDYNNNFQRIFNQKRKGLKPLNITVKAQNELLESIIEKSINKETTSYFLSIDGYIIYNEIVNSIRKKPIISAFDIGFNHNQNLRNKLFSFERTSFEKLGDSYKSLFIAYIIDWILTDAILP